MMIFCKSLFLFILIFLFSNDSFGQAKFKFGLVGGVNFTNFTTDADTKGDLGFNVGVISELKLPIKLGVELDILYSTKGASWGIHFGDAPPPEFFGADLSFSYIDIPLVLKIYSLKVISFQLGAQYSTLLDAKWGSEEVKDEFESFDVSLIGGFGVDVSKVHFSTRYIYGVTSITPDGEVIRNRMLQLALGFWIK